MDRGQILDEAKNLTYGNRAEEYGDVVRNHQGIAELWTAYLNSVCKGCTHEELPFDLTGEHVAHLMMLVKMQRTANVPSVIHADSYFDMTAYAAISGECAHQERCDRE